MKKNHLLFTSWLGRPIAWIGLYMIVAYCTDLLSIPDISAVFTAAHSKVFPELVLVRLPCTLLRWLLAFAVGSFLGVLIGVLIGWNRLVFEILRHDIEILRSLPSVVLLSFVMAIAGTGSIASEIARAFPAAYITLMNVIFLTANHTATLGRRRIVHLKALGASTLFCFRHCVMYELLLQVSIALQQLATISFLVQVSTELISYPPNEKGVGYIMSFWELYSVFPNIVASLVLLALTGWLLNHCVTRASSAISKHLGVRDAFH